MNRRTAGRYGPPRGETGKGMVFMLKEGEVRIPSGCAISGVFHRDGRRENGSGIVAGIAAMHERSNGLGGGFAGYGIYPEYRELYAFHVFYDTVDAQHAAEARLLQDFDVESSGTLPTRPIAAIRDAPSLMRYFAAPKPQTLLDSKLDEREFVVRFVTRVNREIGGAYVFSCGKNMGVFKVTRRTWGNFTVWRNTRATHGRPTAVTLPIRRAGGEVRIRFPFWIIPWCTTARSPAMTQTAALSRCTDIIAACSRIPR